MTFDFLSINIMGRTHQPPYSQNQALCDFYLFGYMKNSLIGKTFTDWEELLQAVNCILDGIEK
jgi:hypothetical protein